VVLHPVGVGVGVGDGVAGERVVHICSPQAITHPHWLVTAGAYRQLAESRAHWGAAGHGVVLHPDGVGVGIGGGVGAKVEGGVGGGVGTGAVTGAGVKLSQTT
jgi:hypothetical protein